ncbi:hypothetical protein VTK56DRAFT_7519 [Thermocarpiscus australiensis]
MAQQGSQNGKDSREGNDDLAQSMKHLTITPSPPARSPRSPRPAAPSALKPVDGSSPSSPSRPSGATRSPLRSSSVSAKPSSRSATPTLLRKASMNSLHSANGITPSRRASSAAVLSPTRPRSGRSPLRSVSPEIPEPRPVPTAQSVASAHFKAELDVLHAPEPIRRADTVVILQDACYGHRFSRPRASRAHLNTIVERPERIKACVLGLSAAYVRLGERHQDGAFPPHPERDAASLPTIPFRFQKSRRRLSLGSQTVTNVHGTKWMEELKMMCDTAEAKLTANGRELQRPDIDRGPNAEAPRTFHEGDLYLCAESLDALEGSLGAVCDAVDAVFSKPQGHQRAFVAIRPPGHHCSASHPSGFCWINNVHVGIMHAILSHGLTHAAIVDFDLHHGDGSQSIAWQHNARSVGLAKNGAWWKKTSIGYFSLHDINSYPCETGDEDKVRNASVCIDNAHGQSIWNVHLQPWKTEADFWALYETKYSILLEKMRAYLKTHTERLRASGLNSRAAIFLSAGFDASEWEDPGMQRHNVNVPTEFYARFTRDVVRIAAEEGTSVEGRIISVLEGGYSNRALCSGVFSHLCGLAGDGLSSKDQDLSGLGYEMAQKISTLRARKDSSASERGARRYESWWWSPAELERLEATLTAPPVEPKKPRTCTPPTYSSPTQSWVAKVVVPKGGRSVSGQPQATSYAGPASFGPAPPPPDVPWTIAAHELSKLLIPSDRQTNSCTPEELNAEATRARRDRQSALAQSVPPIVTPTASGDRPSTRMGLRERKAKPTPLVGDDEDRKARRKTIAGPAGLAAESTIPADLSEKQPKQVGRRLSAASTIVSPEGLDSVPLATRTVKIRRSPKTDATTRPESSMSVRTTNGSGLKVKKTRAPAKKEPAPRPPKAPTKLSSTANGRIAEAARPATSAETPSAEKADDDVDKLAGEMKKIKITVVTKAQREARERERAAREKLSKAEGMSAPSPPEENKPLLPQGQPQPGPATFTPADTITAPLQTSTATGNNSPLSEHCSPAQQQQQQPPRPFQSPAVAQPTDPSTTPSPNGTATSPRAAPPPTTSSPGTKAQTPPAAPPTDMFVPYRPDGPAPPAPAPAPTGALPSQQWLPPNVSATPLASPVGRGDLPVFSSTGVIPFAPARKEEEEEEEERGGHGGA